MDATTLAVASEDSSMSRASAASLGTAIVALTLAFYFIEHQNAKVSSLDAFTVTGDEMVERVSEGDPARHLAIPGLGLFRAILLLRRGGGCARLDSGLAWLLIGYVIWCMASVGWSQNVPMTVRHVSVFLLCCIAALWRSPYLRNARDVRHCARRNLAAGFQ